MEDIGISSIMSLQILTPIGSTPGSPVRLLHILLVRRVLRVTASNPMPLLAPLASPRSIAAADIVPYRLWWI